jgi:hypothetical protein
VFLGELFAVGCEINDLLIGAVARREVSHGRDHNIHPDRHTCPSPIEIVVYTALSSPIVQVMYADRYEAFLLSTLENGSL